MTATPFLTQAVYQAEITERNARAVAFLSIEKGTAANQAACNAAVTRHPALVRRSARVSVAKHRTASKTGRVLRSGLYRRQCGDEADKHRLRPSGNDPSRKEAKQSKQQVE
jgi:hypothetical protein